MSNNKTLMINTVRTAPSIGRIGGVGARDGRDPFGRGMYMVAGVSPTKRKRHVKSSTVPGQEVED